MTMFVCYNIALLYYSINMLNKNFLLHFNSPKNYGKLENFNFDCIVGNPKEGCIIAVQMLINEDIITNIKYKAYGAMAIAAMSWYSQNIKEKSVQTACNVDIESLYNHFEINPVKMNTILLIKEIHNIWTKKFNLKESHHARKNPRN